MFCYSLLTTNIVTLKLTRSMIGDVSIILCIICSLPKNKNKNTQKASMSKCTVNNFINFLILHLKKFFCCFLNRDSLYSNFYKFIHSVCHCDVYSISYMMIL